MRVPSSLVSLTLALACACADQPSPQQAEPEPLIHDVREQHCRVCDARLQQLRERMLEFWRPMTPEELREEYERMKRNGEFTREEIERIEPWMY